MTPRWFRPFTVTPDLRPVLACRYAATVDGRHDLIPDGCVDLIAIDDGPIVVCGPDTRAWSFELPAGTAVTGVRFHPGAAARVFRVDADALLDQRVDLAQLVPPSRVRHLADQLAGAGECGRLDVLEGAVRALAGTADPDPDGTVAVAGVVASGRSPGVDHLAAGAGISGRQLRRRFERCVGYGPAYLARVARLQRFAGAAGRAPHVPIAALAAEAGYADQAHLAKDCRAIADVTPRQLVALVPRSSVVSALADVRSVQDNRAAAA